MRDKARIASASWRTEHEALLCRLRHGDDLVPPPMPDAATVMPDHEAFALKMAEPATARIETRPTETVPGMIWIVPKAKLDDEGIIGQWVRDRAASKHVEGDARRTLAFFRANVTKKPLRECTRDDGRKLADLLLAKPKGNGWATVDKSVGLLKSACNVADLEPNPFSWVMPARKAKDVVKDKRLSMPEDDLKRLMENVDGLSANDGLLFKLLVATGMRISEALSIREEHRERGVRFVWVGTKNTSSWRRVALPSALLGDLPERIDAPLFPHDTRQDGLLSDATEKRLRYWSKKHGVGKHARTGEGDSRVVIHSLRHRAKEIAPELGIDWQTQLWLLGHERQVSDQYGNGYPLGLLRKAVDKIAAASFLPG